MIYYDKIQGLEFDWFAFDADGSLALFSTAGGGLIPSDVVPLVDAFCELADRFETPNWGTEKIWDDYANLGLFVFDGDYSGNPYKRVRVPACELAPQVSDMMAGIPDMPRFPGRFSSIEILESWPEV